MQRGSALLFLLIGVGLVGLLILIWMTLGHNLVKDPLTIKGEEIAKKLTAQPSQMVKGEVTRVDLNAKELERNGVLVVNADGQDWDVVIPSGKVKCPGLDNVDFSKMRVGAVIEANGSVGPDNQLTVCVSKDHYLRSTN